jgi:uncharacterized protein YecE (DUF72 family)
MTPEARIYVGCATWAIGASNDHLLPPGRGNLARYAQRLTAAEVNSSFHRSHRQSTWARWSASVGPSFRFAVKAPKTITHERRLAGVDDLLAAFLEEIEPLGAKLGPILVQLPPSFAWDERVFAAFVDLLAGRRVVVEPRHPSWFEDEVEAFLAEREIARVAADPAVVPRAAEPGGWDGLRYFRLHGSPVTYRSPYPDAVLDGLAARLQPGDWCVFDNTASGAALPNAVALMSRLRAR